MLVPCPEREEEGFFQEEDAQLSCQAAWWWVCGQSPSPGPCPCAGGRTDAEAESQPPGCAGQCKFSEKEPFCCLFRCEFRALESIFPGYRLTLWQGAALALSGGDGTRQSTALASELPHADASLAHRGGKSRVH